MFDRRDLIHAYSRCQAIEDGVLIDATATAREAGIRYPVDLTTTWGLAGQPTAPGGGRQKIASSSCFCHRRRSYCPVAEPTDTVPALFLPREACS
jgi:hypothetical protein